MISSDGVRNFFCIGMLSLWPMLLLADTKPTHVSPSLHPLVTSATAASTASPLPGDTSTAVVVASSAPLGLKNTPEAQPDLKKNVLRNFAGLLLVLGLLLLLVTLYKRTHLYKNFHEQPLRLVLSLALSPKQKLAVVELFGGYSLVAISEKSVNLIQVLQPGQVIALEAYLATKKSSRLAAGRSKLNEVSQDEKIGFENLLKKILNNVDPKT